TGVQTCALPIGPCGAVRALPACSSPPDRSVVAVPCGLLKGTPDTVSELATTDTDHTRARAAIAPSVAYAARVPQPFSGPDFALTSAYPEIVPFRQAVTAQDWPSARAALLALNPALVEYAILDVAEADGVETFLAKVVEADAADTLAATAYAARLVVQGWEIRTGARARDVSREQFEAFHDHLKRAERLLIDVTARDPSLLAAW